jgi:hypothetical protein
VGTHLSARRHAFRVSGDLIYETVVSKYGALTYKRSNEAAHGSTAEDEPPIPWTFETFPWSQPSESPAFAYAYTPDWEFELWIPYRYLVALFAIFAGVPWIRQFRWRFTLRTLLIATTLVAVVLGLIVWLR